MVRWYNDISMNSTHNEHKSVVAGMFIRTLKSKKYKTLTANDSKPYFGYLNKLVDKYNNIYRSSANEKLVDVDCFDLNKEIQSIHKATKFEVGNRVRHTKYKNILWKSYTKNWWTEIFLIEFVIKTNPWVYKMKDLNEEK